MSRVGSPSICLGDLCVLPPGWGVYGMWGTSRLGEMLWGTQSGKGELGGGGSVLPPFPVPSEPAALHNALPHPMAAGPARLRTKVIGIKAASCGRSRRGRD